MLFIQTWKNFKTRKKIQNQLSQIEGGQTFDEEGGLLTKDLIFTEFRDGNFTPTS